MCGIIGIASNKPVSINIINSLKKLKIVNCFGLSGISYFKKKGPISRALFNIIYFKLRS